MSAKDVADAILRDFRTSMADAAIYRFSRIVEASAVYDELDEQDWLMAERRGPLITLEVRSLDERILSI